MSDTLTTSPSTELVPVISVDSSDAGSSNTNIIASAALAAGVLIGVFGVPPVGRIVRGWFTRTKPEEDVVEVVKTEKTPAKVEKTV